MPLHKWHMEFHLPIRAHYLAAAQERGRIRSDLDPVWLFDVLVALITQAAGHTRTDPSARSAMLRATVRSIVAPSSAG